MYGAIIGDIAGSRFEFQSCKQKDFQLIHPRCRFTDDTVMTAAVAEALLTDGDFTAAMRKWGRRYPGAGYGQKFLNWIFSPNPQPYGSWGNGSAMRVSPCGLVAKSLEEALELAEKSAVVSHDHPEAIRGAKAIAAAVYLAANGGSKEEIRRYIETIFYPLDFTLDEIRPGYRVDVSCQGSVPQAIQAFLESRDFEDAIRGAISLGGDSDTIGAMTGSIAWHYYSYPHGPTDRMKEIWQAASGFLTEDLRNILRELSEVVDK